MIGSGIVLRKTFDRPLRCQCVRVQDVSYDADACRPSVIAVLRYEIVLVWGSSSRTKAIVMDVGFIGLCDTGSAIAR